MHLSISYAGPSRSFPEGFPEVAVQGVAGNADTLLILGAEAGNAFRQLTDRDRFRLILIELDNECLGVHTGEGAEAGAGTILGFARFCLGNGAPSNLVEIVHPTDKNTELVGEARALFEQFGLQTAVCADFPGRIVNRLVRPYYNDSLAMLDDRVGTAADIDLTIRLGLGYPEGPIELLERTGLAEHFDVSAALYRALGEMAYLPARRAQVAKARNEMD